MLLDRTRVKFAGIEGVVAGRWEGKVRIRLDVPDYTGRDNVLVDPVELDVIGMDDTLVAMPLCPSCGGGGKIEWTDEDGWQHEAPCETCEGEADGA
ncbi:hypothetical protein [Streptomyces sp. NPDC059063]|uniref:hypothetical protein n=1 Tax=unclassified Streptomyces TaxID=2593676 RepID=UPI00367D95AF